MQNTTLYLIGQKTGTHLQKHETVSSMSSGSTVGEGLGAGDGGTLRYLTCSTRRAARAPLRRRIPTGQRAPDRPPLSSQPPPPAELILRTHTAPPCTDTFTTAESDTIDRGTRVCSTHVCVARPTEGGCERTRRRRAVTSRLISTPVCAGTPTAAYDTPRRNDTPNNTSVYTAQCTANCKHTLLHAVV